MTAHPRQTRLLAALAPLLLVGGLAACSDDKADETSSPTESVAVAPADTAAVVDPAPVETSVEAQPEAAAPSGGVTLTDGEAPPERTIVMAGDTMAPNALSIKVGENVTFRTGDELHAVIVGDLSGATVNKGLIETFVFTQPGTYPVRDDLTSATATITVG